MRIEARALTGDEAAAIVAALEALLAPPVETGVAAMRPTNWRLAARAFDDGLDAERANRRAKRRSS